MPDEQPLSRLGADIEAFPDPNHALIEPNGLLAIGGDLSSQRLLAAYRRGIFPWFDEEPILWWCPHPRAVLFLSDLSISHSLKKTLKRGQFDVKMDENFAGVIQQCAAPRLRHGHIEQGTWITPEMQKAYIDLHQQGYAHSVEVYVHQQLVGGVYGVSLGRNFFAESMFSKQRDASKIALVHLVLQLQQWNFEFIDCQIWSAHLATLGVTTLDRSLFLQKVAANNKFDSKIGKWHLAPGLLHGSLLAQ